MLGGIFTQNVWAIAVVFIGTVIGAGFATGQEIQQFFVNYGNLGMFGILISISVFTLLVCAILCKIASTGASNVTQYLGNDFPEWFKKIYFVISVLFMLVSYTVMITATGEMFRAHLGLSKWIGIIFMDALCVYCFFKGEKGLVGINKFLTPIIIIAVVYIFLYGTTKPVFKAIQIFNNVPVSAFVYVSYNTIGLIAVLTSVSSLVKNKTTAVLAALIGGVILLITALCVFLILKNSGATVGEIPMLDAVTTKFKPLYFVVLLCAIATTAVASGVGVINNIKANKGVVICALLVISTIMEMVGFKELVAKGYSIFGYIGFVILIFTIIDGKKYFKRR